MQLRKLMVPVAAVALSVTACGGEDSSSDDQAPANGDEAGDEASADDSDVEDDSDDDPGDEADAGDGGDGAAPLLAMAEAFADAGSFEFETTTTEAGQEATVTGAMQLGSGDSPTNIRMSMNQGGVETMMLIVDGQVFIELTEDMGIPAEGSWLTFGPDGDSELGEQMTGAFDDIGDAANLSEELAENAEHLTVTEAGSATVDGVETTEYHVVDADGVTGMGESTMWIDGDNLPRRMVQEVEGGEPDEIFYRNFGVDVDIEAPPEDEVVDINDMMNQ